MVSQGVHLTGVPSADLLSILFESNHLSEDQVIWRNGEDERQAITKRVARQLVRRISNGYVSTGLISPKDRERDVVVMLSENQVIGFANILAIIAAGGIVATCPWQATIPEILFRVRILRPKAIVCSKHTLSVALSALKQSSHPFEIIIQDSSKMQVWNKNGESYLLDSEREWETAWNEEIANRPAVLVFSSGTTGTPKGVCISQRNIISMIFQLRILLQPITQKLQHLRMPGTLDSAHVAGVFVNAFSPLGVGIENFLIPATDINLLLLKLAEHHMEVYFTVPAILARIANHPEFNRVNLKNIKFIGTGAARTPVETQRLISNKLAPGTFCQMAWGMTEITFLATMHPPGVQGPWESIGKPLAGNSIKICDSEGNELPIGESGEIYISGPTVTSGYYLAQLIDHDSKKNGWFRTGDLGNVDENGYVYVSGRNKDLIKYNGTQVSPEELEKVIMKHDYVEDAGVVGTELEDGNELPTAFVVLKDDSPSSVIQDIIDFVAREASPYKRLRGGVYVLPIIPKNAMGKTQHKDLRVMAKQRYQLAQKKPKSRL